MVELNKLVFSDAYAFLRDVPDSTVDATITSPPGYRKKRQLPADHKLAPFEMGQEPTPEAYLAGMFDVFDAVYRVTKPTGSLWLHLPDSRLASHEVVEGYRDGELMGIPDRVTTALRRCGWRLMSEIIWSKTNANHFAAHHRPSDAHDKILVFAKQAAFYFDWFAAQEEADDGKKRAILRKCRNVWTCATESLNGQRLLGEELDDYGFLEVDDKCEVHGEGQDGGAGPLFRFDSPKPCTCKAVERGAIQATPGAIVARCVAASTSERGNCTACGKPWYRMLKNIDRTPNGKTRTMVEVSGGFVPDCKCGRFESMHEAAKPIILDPFSGSGTTKLAANMLGRDFIGSELDPRFVSRVAPARIAKGLRHMPKVLPLPG